MSLTEAKNEAFEEAVKIIEAQLCQRSAVDYALNMCILEIRRLQSPSAANSQSPAKEKP
jgi:hypothetical protein